MADDVVLELPSTHVHHRGGALPAHAPPAHRPTTLSRASSVPTSMDLRHQQRANSTAYSLTPAQSHTPAAGAGTAGTGTAGVGAGAGAGARDEEEGETHAAAAAAADGGGPLRAGMASWWRGAASTACSAFDAARSLARTVVSTALAYVSAEPPAGPPLATKAAAEFTGCMIFHFLGSASPTPLTNATALAVLVYYTAKLSGAHLNPALTMTFALLGYTTPRELLVYWVAQVSGCMVGALWLAALLPGKHLIGEARDGGLINRDNYPLYGKLGCFQRGDGGGNPGDVVTHAQAFGWEAVCTFCFILPIFSVVWYTQSKSGYGNTGPIIVGLSLYAAASAAAPWTGAALNPARVLASSVVFACAEARSEMWYYVLGELCGAAVVPLAIVPWYGVSARLVGAIEEQELAHHNTNNASSRYGDVNENHHHEDRRSAAATSGGTAAAVMAGSLSRAFIRRSLAQQPPPQQQPAYDTASDSTGGGGGGGGGGPASSSTVASPAPANLQQAVSGDYAPHSSAQSVSASSPFAARGLPHHRLTLMLPHQLVQREHMMIAQRSPLSFSATPAAAAENMYMCATANFRLRQRTPTSADMTAMVATTRGSTGGDSNGARTSAARSSAARTSAARTSAPRLTP